jgi:glycolate oxidase FAD binding subunit
MAESVKKIDGITLEREVTPASVEELAGIMETACAAGHSMIPIGGGTEMHLGNAPRSARLGIHTRGLRGAVEYEPDNLTVSVRAGTTLQELQEILKRENQFLPIDPPCPDRATLGGLLATNASGPLRFRYSTLRDMLLGIKVVHADGTRTQAGGKLVKNVTGYDMGKLYAGSLGTLGIISEMTFKVQPTPEAVATAIVSYPSLPAVLEAAQNLLEADLMPEALEALNGTAFAAVSGAAPQSGWVLLARLGETDAAVRWQLDRLRELTPADGGTTLNVLGPDESTDFWRRLASARHEANGGGDLWLKCSVLCQSAAATERRLTESGQRLEAQSRIFCHAGVTVFHARYCWPGRTCESDDLTRAVTELRRECAAVGGHLVVEKAPTDVKRRLDVWGYEAPALELMRRIKNQFDPKGVLNPGRFVGGI